MAPALEQVAQRHRPEAATDALQPGGVLTGGEAVVEGSVGKALLLRLTLGPLVAVAADPHRERGIAAHLDEARTELGVVDVEVVEVREHRLAGELEVRMAIASPVPPPPPGALLLLRDAHEHHAVEAPLPGLRQVGRGNVLLALALGEADQGDGVVGDEALDVVHEALADLAERRRRGDGVAPVQQEADDLVLGHQPRHVGMHEHPVHRAN